MESSLDRSVIRKVDTDEAGSDFAFWQTRPYHERLSALESIRREYHAWRYGDEPRFQRVYRIIEHE